jgi:hypothetical protein
MAKNDKNEKRRLIGARCELEFAARVEEAAERDSRTVSSYVRRVLADALEHQQQGEAA